VVEESGRLCEPHLAVFAAEYDCDHSGRITLSRFRQAVACILGESGLAADGSLVCPDHLVGVGQGKVLFLPRQSHLDILLP